jgi:hypothetical protein
MKAVTSKIEYEIVQPAEGGFDPSQTSTSSIESAFASPKGWTGSPESGISHAAQDGQAQNRPSAGSISSEVEKLLVVLDKDIQQIEQSLSILDQLRSLLIKHDDAAMNKLLGNIQADVDNYAANQLERQSIRKELANRLGCNIEQMTLSKLGTVLMGDKRIQIADRKGKLKALISKLKKEYFSTALLLSECARFNNLLLRSIFDLGKVGTIIYSSDGSASQQTNMNLVDLKF